MGSSPKITGGRLRGRLLAGSIPDSARPTSSRVREALFSIVGHDLTGLRVLDAFGGSGLLAFEAWSRGATVVVVERNRAAAASIRQSAAALGAEVALHCADVTAVVAELGTFDLVLVDPPYAAPVEPILASLRPAVRGRLSLEADSRTAVPSRIGGLALERSRQYGGTSIHLYRAEA